MSKRYCVYILKCNNGNYYTGYTSDLVRRYQEHLEGTIKCKYTRSFKPLGIAGSWQVRGGKSAAMRLENLIKNLSKSEKEQLIANPDSITVLKKSMCKAV